MSKPSPRQRILPAVVVCIAKYGIDKLTTRKIAEQAGTNAASINYYFRSKDELLAEALARAIHPMLEEVLAAIDDQERPFQAVREEVFFYLIDGATRSPGGLHRPPVCCRGREAL
ncbi:MAG: helix-turn-helix transcriptional regulator [Anaerolineales bacterium]|nr:helix-turn-helix transcriptional regulator [Anaerolineales bacterium]